MSGPGWDEECRGWSGTWGGRIREDPRGSERLLCNNNSTFFPMNFMSFSRRALNSSSVQGRMVVYARAGGVRAGCTLLSQPMPVQWPPQARSDQPVLACTQNRCRGAEKRSVSRCKQRCGAKRPPQTAVSLAGGFCALRRTRRSEERKRSGPALTGGEWPLSPSPVSASRSQRRPRDRRERSKHVAPPSTHCRLGYPRRLQCCAPGEMRGNISKPSGSFQDWKQAEHN